MTFQTAVRAALTVGFAAVATLSAQAQDAKAPPAALAAPAAAAADASKPEAWVGLSVTSSDGTVMGKVTSLKAAGDGKGPLLYISSPTDGKIFTVPSELATLSGAGLQLKATSAELGKMVK
jgi:hypothetical protein